MCLRGKGEMMKGRDKKRDTRVANLRRLHHADSTHGRAYSPVGEEFADEDEEDAAALDRFGGVVFVDLAAITTPEGHYIGWKRRGYEVEDLAVEDVAAQNNAKEGEEQEIEFQDSFAIESE